MYDHEEASLGFPAGGHDGACILLMHVLSAYLPISKVQPSYRGSLRSISIPSLLPQGQCFIVRSDNPSEYMDATLRMNHCARAWLVLESGCGVRYSILLSVVPWLRELAGQFITHMNEATKVS